MKTKVEKVSKEEINSCKEEVNPSKKNPSRFEIYKVYASHIKNIQSKNEEQEKQ